MKQVERKIVKVDGTSSCWYTGSSNRTIVAIETEKEEGKNIGVISMDKLSGADLTVQEFENVLCSNKYFIENAKEYIAYKRVNPFSVIKHGNNVFSLYTGNTKNTKVAKFNHKPQATIYVSGFNKIPLSYIDKIWVGDLVEILLEIDPAFELKLNIALAMFNKYSEAELAKASKEKLGISIITDNPAVINSEKFYPKYRNVIEGKIKNLSIETLMDKLNDLEDLKHLCSPTCTTVHLKGEYENKRDRKRVERARRSELHDPEGITPLEDEEEDPWL